MITHETKLVPLVLKPRNRPGKIKDSKETTVTVIKNNCSINRYTSKYPLNQKVYSILTVFKAVKSAAVPTNIC